MEQPTEERFLNDIRNHEIEIYRDDGLNRHLKFRKPNTIHMWFDIITWKNSLLITGDMGTYVFRRLPDMFSFFRMSENDRDRMAEKDRTLAINPDYWSEKVQAADPYDGIMKWSADNFRQTVKRWFENYYYDQDLSEEEKEDIWSDIKFEIFRYADNESMAIHDAMRFSHNGDRPFQDIWDTDCRVYTYHFIWCLFAIVWAIDQYDEMNSKSDAPNS